MERLAIAPSPMSPASESQNRATLGYIAPFAVFVTLMALERAVGLPAGWFFPIRFLVVLGILATVSRRLVSLRASMPIGSVAVGFAVFLVWIGPDLLFGPTYRQHWLFANPVTGQAVSSIPADLKRNFGFIVFRIMSCVVTVPILEELFWRGWLMRWLVAHDFRSVRVGEYARPAFWLVALLFASEHGPYWDVGLAAGIIYNWWCIRTKNLADCIVAHAVTNFLLSAYVLWAGQWQYWL